MMKVCNDIKRRIDEADQPDQPGLEITAHTALCAACREFADQRATLRSLVAAGARVSAPVNFDALLKARLAEVKASKSFAWFSPAVYLRFGAATAAIVGMVFAAQYSNLFSTEQPSLATVSRAAQPGQSTFAPLPLVPVTPPKAIAPTTPTLAVVGRSVGSRRDNVARTPFVTRDAITLDDGSVIIMRGQNGEREVPMPTVSVGAQPLLYVNAGRQPQPTRPVSTSF